MGTLLLLASLKTCASCRGIVQTLSSCNSDVLYLKKLLFYDGAWPLKEQMEKHYYAYRQRKLTNSHSVSKQQCGF